MLPADPELTQSDAPRARQETGEAAPSGPTAPEVMPDADRPESAGESPPAGERGTVDALTRASSSKAEQSRAPDMAASEVGRAGDAAAETGSSGSAEGAGSTADTAELETFYIFRFQPRNRG